MRTKYTSKCYFNDFTESQGDYGITTLKDNEQWYEINFEGNQAKIYYKLFFYKDTLVSEEMLQN